MNRAAQCGCFEKFSLGMISCKWDGDFRFECNNSPGRIGAHFFRCFNRHPLEADRVPLGSNSHNCRHTGGKSSRH